MNLSDTQLLANKDDLRIFYNYACTFYVSGTWQCVQFLIFSYSKVIKQYYVEFIYFVFP